MITLKKILKTKVECSITIESAMVFTLMMFILFMCMGPMFICKTSVDIIKSLDKTTKTLSYLKEIELDVNNIDISKVNNEEFPYDTDVSSDNTEGIKNLTNTLLVSAILLKDNYNNNNPFSNISLILPRNINVYDDDTGIISYDYDITFRQPLNILNILGIKQRFILNRRAFIGSDGNRQYYNNISSNSEAYYIANDYKKTKIYHAFVDCSYLEKKVTRTTYEEVKSKYHKCSYCIKGNMDLTSEVIYITKTGDAYHIRSDCPSMTAYVTVVDKNFVESNDLSLCSRCSKRNTE